MEHLFTRTGVAKFLHVSVSTIRRWEEQGLLSRIKGPGLRGMIRFREEHIQDLLKRFEQQGKDVRAPKSDRLDPLGT